MLLVSGICVNLNVRMTKDKTMLTVTLLILLSAFVCIMGHVLKGLPLWIGVLLMLIVQLLAVIPIK
jgi:hypothetical protein